MKISPFFKRGTKGDFLLFCNGLKMFLASIMQTFERNIISKIVKLKELYEGFGNNHTLSIDELIARHNLSEEDIINNRTNDQNELILFFNSKILDEFKTLWTHFYQKTFRLYDYFT